MKKIRKQLLVIFLLGTLLIAGFFFYKKEAVSKIKSPIVKPSQLTFVEQNVIPSTNDNNPKSTRQIKALGSKNFAAASLEGNDKLNWLTFEKIMKSKNDNDPRMDSQLKNLSPAFHEALYETYEQLPAEDRSAKGLVVYLISRNINSEKDLQFLKKIYEEPACLSLADCKSIGKEDPHHSSVTETTLTYPQQVALFLIEKELKEKPQLLNDAAYRNRLNQVLVQAENFQVPAVREKAHAIRVRYGL